MTPRVADERAVSPRNMMNLQSSYIAAAKGVLPNAGDVKPWRARSGYFWDYWEAMFGGLQGLEFVREIGVN